MHEETGIQNLTPYQPQPVTNLIFISFLSGSSIIEITAKLPLMWTSARVLMANHSHKHSIVLEYSCTCENIRLSRSYTT